MNRMAAANSRREFTMRQASIVLSLLIAIALVGAACGASEVESAGSTAEARTVTTLGFAQEAAPATQARLQFIVTATGRDADAITVEALQPLVDALVSSGVDAASIEATLPSDPYRYYADPYSRGSPFGGSPGEVTVALHDITGERLGQVVETVNHAADESSTLRVQHVGVLYGVDDCAALHTTAYERAIADARERAGTLAAVLDGSLGEIASVSEEGFGWGMSGPSLCDPAPARMGPGAPYMSQQPLTVEASPVLSVTFIVK
jgi:uncharacterized protein YggE